MLCLLSGRETISIALTRDQCRSEPFVFSRSRLLHLKSTPKARSKFLCGEASKEFPFVLKTVQRTNRSRANFSIIRMARDERSV